MRTHRFVKPHSYEDGDTIFNRPFEQSVRLWKTLNARLALADEGWYMMMCCLWQASFDKNLKEMKSWSDHYADDHIYGIFASQ